jgi:hypothetical protein
MAVRYDGDDGVTDLELVDLSPDEDPTCCIVGEFLNSCSKRKCKLGQLSSLMRWHVEDPPDDEERARNDLVEARQGNRNPFIDLPQLAWLLWNSTSATRKSDPAFAEILSDCGRDNSSIASKANWNVESSRLTLTLQRRVAPGDIVNVTIPSAILPSHDLFHNDARLKVSAQAANGPFDAISIQDSPPTGPLVHRPVINFDHNSTAGGITSLSYNITLSRGIGVGD